jgi:hypothetical protein
MPSDRPTGAAAFRPAELDDAEGLLASDGPVDLGLVRELERLAATTAARPSAGFSDRVMTAIAAEPAPAPVRAAGAAIRRHAGRDLLAAIRDAFRVTLGRSFPVAVRVQAFALVLLVVALSAGSGIATAGAIGWLRDSRVIATPTDTTPPASPLLRSDSPQGPTGPDGSPDSSASHEPGDSTASPEPGDSADASGDPGKSVMPGDDGSGLPTSTPESHDDGGVTPSPSETAGATVTPSPSETPRPTGTPQEGSGVTDSPTPSPSHAS